MAPTLLLLVLAALATSQAAASCSDGQAVSSLDEDRLLGTWYLVKKTTFPHASHRPAKCQQITFSRSSSGDLKSVFSAYNTSASNYLSFTDIFHKSTEGSTDGKYDVHREGGPDGKTSKFNVVSIDYDKNFWSSVCGKLPRSEETFVVNFLWTRERNPSVEDYADADNSLPRGDYATSDQTDCPELESQ